MQIRCGRTWKPKCGGAGGHRRHYVFVPGEYITEIYVRRGALVDQLQWKTGVVGLGTSHGRKMTVAGGNGGSQMALKGSKKRPELYAIAGRAGSHMDQITFGFGPQEPDPNKKCAITANKKKAETGQKLKISFSHCYEAPSGTGWIGLIKSQAGSNKQGDHNRKFLVRESSWNSGSGRVELPGKAKSGL